MMAWEASNHDAPGRNPPCFTPLESNASETSHVVNRRRASRVVWVMDMAVLEEVVVDAVDGRRLVITVGRWMEETGPVEIASTHEATDRLGSHSVSRLDRAVGSQI